jgi:hypothetical protein
MEFLWVRWFESIDNEQVQNSWPTSRRQLDRLRFPLMDLEEAFGFVDPAHVLRGSHIMQGFSKGKVYADGVGASRFARDVKDWHRYYIGR